MLDNNLPLLQVHQPLTFLERGVAVPFTTPALEGARVRSGKSSVIEFILPSPSGGRGVYVVQWTGVQRFCQPSVHDVLLQGRIVTLPAFSPATIRLAARDVAAQGYAGQAARQAAIAATAADQAAIEEANRLLLANLVEQLQSGPGRIGCASLSLPQLEALGRQAIVRVAPVLGVPVEAIGRALTALAKSFAAIGVEDPVQPARLTGLLQRTIRVSDALSAWPEDGTRAAGAAVEIAKAAQAATSCAAILTRETRGLGTNVLALIRSLLATPADTQRRVERLDWLLDGWGLLCLLWENASQPSQRRAAMLEMAPLIPILPPEIRDWVGRANVPSAPQVAWQAPASDDGSRGAGSAFATLARNECFRALSM